jgi:hypothetical protein
LTVKVNVVFCVTLPEVPVIVTVEVPLGVPLYLGLLSLHPTANNNPPMTRRVITVADALRRFPGISSAIPNNPSPVNGIQTAVKIPGCTIAAVVDAVVVTVRTTLVAAIPEAMVEGAKVHVDLAGRPEQANVTAALIPGFGVNEMFSVAVPPAVVLTVGSDAARVNPGFTTVTLAVAWAVAPFVSTTLRITLVTPTE